MSALVLDWPVELVSVGAPLLMVAQAWAAVLVVAAAQVWLVGPDSVAVLARRLVLAQPVKPARGPVVVLVVRRVAASVRMPVAAWVAKPAWVLRRASPVKPVSPVRAV